MFWGIAGFLVGVIIALQLAFPALNFDLPCRISAGLRPLHTSAVIFAFGGNVLLATSFYVVQRTCQARSRAILTPWFVVLGYNLHRHRRHGLPARHHAGQGIRRTRVVRRPVADAGLGRLPARLPRTLWKRKEPHIYVANWFYARLHRDDRDAASRQQRDGAGVDLLAEELHRLVRRAGRDVPVVVRP
jgi:cytochrome c oxidase cbb3-type subunit 1